jgi:hypothetical protein
MTTVEQAPDKAGSANDLRCSSYSKSRARFCLAFGRYACKDMQCRHRACGLHVIRNERGIFCPQCSGPVATAKH